MYLWLSDKEMNIRKHTYQPGMFSGKAICYSILKFWIGNNLITFLAHFKLNLNYKMTKKFSKNFLNTEKVTLVFDFYEQLCSKYVVCIKISVVEVQYKPV